MESPAPKEGPPIDHGSQIGDGDVIEDVDAGLLRNGAMGCIKSPVFKRQSGLAAGLTEGDEGLSLAVAGIVFAHAELV